MNLVKALLFSCGPRDGSFKEFSGEIGGVFNLERHGCDPFHNVLRRSEGPFCDVAIEYLKILNVP